MNIVRIFVFTRIFYEVNVIIVKVIKKIILIKSWMKSIETFSIDNHDIVKRFKYFIRYV